MQRASGGHSPSARAVVNASDLVSSLALAADPAKPSLELRDRLLSIASLQSISGELEPPSARSASRALSRLGGPIEAAHETLTRMHIGLPEDLERRRLIDELGAAGGLGHEEADAQIRALLDRMAPFVDYEVVLVSIVRGPDTVHRVHRGFPMEFGNVDVIPRAVSFCTHCVSADAPLVVHDAASEAFFRQSVMARQMGALAYLGVPIRASGATPLGALCCIGGKPRQILASEVELVAHFASEAEAIVTKDAATTAAIRAESPLWLGAVGQTTDGPGIVYRDVWFKTLLELELARFRALAGAGPREASQLLMVDRAVDRPVLEAFLANGAFVVGELPGGCYGILVAGRKAPPGSEAASIAVASAASCGRLVASLPGARGAAADVAWGSADAWIAAAG